MKVSIAMATYNGGRYIQEQLNSIASQTRLPDELVITDDCSTDNTLRLIEDFAQRAPFPVRRYKNSRNMGFAQNFNRAITLCNGDYILPSDQDDNWLNKKIEALLNEIKGHANKPTLVHSDFSLIDQNGCIIRNSFHKMRGKNINNYNKYIVKSLYHGIGSGCTMLFNRSLVDICLPIPDIGIGHDHWLLYGAILRGKVLYLNDQLILHRVHANNTAPKFQRKTYKLLKRDKVAKKIITANALLQKHGQYIDIKTLNSLKMMSKIKRINAVKILLFYFSSRIPSTSKFFYSLYILVNLYMYKYRNHNSGNTKP